MNQALSLSFILPVYNKRNSIPHVVSILIETIEKEIGLQDYELVFVDDGSTDDSLKLLKQYTKQHSTIRIIEHPSNMGQLKALETGLRNTSGLITLMTSCDLQNPLQKSAELYKAVQEGADCAIAYREKRKEKGFKSFLSVLFMWGLALIFPKFPKGGFDFVATGTKLKEELLKKDFDDIFLQLEILKLSKNTFWLPVTRLEDELDSSAWSIRYRIKYALKAIKYLFQ